MEERYVLAADEGTTSARAMVFDQDGVIRGTGQYSFSQIYPEVGWVEQSPTSIWGAQLRSIRAALMESGVGSVEMAALGVTNQRETTIVWDRRTGRPLYNAVVWQCRRTADAVEALKREYMGLFKEKTGLVPDSYFSGPKLSWLLENVPGLMEKAVKGEALFGTVDTYLLYRLTGGRVHATDYSNASRTLMFNIHSLDWDEELLEVLGVPGCVLPEPLPSSALYGYTDPKVFGARVPICGVAGDQQAALFGHTAFNEGDSKPPPPGLRGPGGLGGGVTYALEGSVFVTGAAIQWLRDSLKMLRSSAESEALASSLGGNDGVYFVPALTGLGAPYWDQYARGAITGITRGTGRAHIARAALEAIAYLTCDVVEAMTVDSGLKVNELRVDGGATRNNFLMQFQSDILGLPLAKPNDVEATAKGDAFFAGLAVDFWGSPEELRGLPVEVEMFQPRMGEE
jgi:glycerol kinase